MSRDFKLVVGIVFVVTILFCGGGEVLLQGAFHLAFGWLWNAREVWPRVRVNVGGVALFAIAMALAAWLAHGVGRWLWNDAGRPWRWKWTVLGLAAVMLMFVSGVAATGVVHQAGWLIRSPIALTYQTNSREIRNRLKCAANLRDIGKAIAAHEKAGGDRPRTRREVAQLVLTQRLAPEVFCCPASDTEKATTTQPSDLPAAIDDDRHFAYLVCPEPLPGPVAGKRVVIYEPLDNHDGEGLVVLFDDGTTEWLNGDDAKRWLAATTRPTE